VLIFKNLGAKGCQSFRFDGIFLSEKEWSGAFIQTAAARSKPGGMLAIRNRPY
jgi:hypothetical protein